MFLFQNYYILKRPMIVRLVLIRVWLFSFVVDLVFLGSFRAITVLSQASHALQLLYWATCSRRTTKFKPLIIPIWATRTAKKNPFFGMPLWNCCLIKKRVRISSFKSGSGHTSQQPLFLLNQPFLLYNCNYTITVYALLGLPEWAFP